MWVFNPVKVELQFLTSVDEIQTGMIDMGLGDLSIDTGDRMNDTSSIDQGERI